MDDAKYNMAVFQSTQRRLALRSKSHGSRSVTQAVSETSVSTYLTKSRSFGLIIRYFVVMLNNMCLGTFPNVCRVS
jgi:hypothetical protein